MATKPNIYHRFIKWYVKQIVFFNNNECAVESSVFSVYDFSTTLENVLLSFHLIRLFFVIVWSLDNSREMKAFNVLHVFFHLFDLVDSIWHYLAPFLYFSILMAPAEIEINRMRVCNSNKHQKTIIFTQVRNEHEQKRKNWIRRAKKTWLQHQPMIIITLWASRCRWCVS